MLRVIGALLLIISIIALYRKAPAQIITFNKESSFSIETAESELSKAIGLMFRPYLAENRGMLFIFPNNGYHPMWMKLTLIPLDMLWLNQDLEVIYIENRAKPCITGHCKSYRSPTNDARYVLELKGNSVQKYNIHIGDKAELLR